MKNENHQNNHTFPNFSILTHRLMKTIAVLIMLSPLIACNVNQAPSNQRESTTKTVENNKIESEKEATDKFVYDQSRYQVKNNNLYREGKQIGSFSVERKNTGKFEIEMLLDVYEPEVIEATLDWLRQYVSFPKGIREVIAHAFEVQETVEFDHDGYEFQIIPDSIYKLTIFIAQSTKRLPPAGTDQKKESMN